MKTCLLTLVAFAFSTTVAHSQGFSPQEAMQHMTTAPGLKVTLFASEPEVRQPIFVKCDDRGRLWTIQYLQYPNPAGLKRVKVDRWSRTVYDRVPKPPPDGPRGADRITILEDSDGDGHADLSKDFVDGLNLVTGVEFGYGGVFVLNVPYLLFYPDQNRDDVPDSDPEVLLTGFGMEDAQAMSNHLTWGPDGWLYGVNGSTTTCQIRGIEFQQGLWRYHPVTHEFELFCEGGGNCYGLTFDANGECYYSTNAGPFVHAVQGGYYYKSFGKHGPLHNLYAYHHFPELERDAAPGGPPTGGTVYLADAFPPPMRGSFIAGNFLGHTVSWWKVTRSGSTVRASYGGVLWDSHDTWSGPTDICLGPDGSLYISDFYDQRTAHPDPDANWDRSNGRIYKISAEAASPWKTDVGKRSTDALVDLLAHQNHWFAVRARLELARRREPRINARLRTMARQTEDNRLALEGLWALHAVDGFDDSLALELLNHPYPYVRYWTIRLVGDKRIASSEVENSLVEHASRETNPVVRGQLAATAKRLPTEVGMRIVEALLRHFPTESDSRISWLIWWAIESKATSDADYLVKMFTKDVMWENPAARENILRLIRRFAAEGTADSYKASVALLKSTPVVFVAPALQSLRQGLTERPVGLQGVGQGNLFNDQATDGAGHPTTETRKFEPVSGPLREYIEALWRQKPDDELRLELALRTGIDTAPVTLAETSFNPNLTPKRRISMLRLLREFGEADTGPQLVKLVLANEPEPVRLAALDALAGYESEEVTQSLLEAYARLPTNLQSKVRDTLVSRPASALTFLQQVDAGSIDTNELSIEQLRHAALHGDEKVNALVRKHWGNIGPGSAEEKLATMRRYNNDLRAAVGDANRGKELYTKHCAICHKLYADGNTVGPDLTTANRQDRAALLANIVDPSAVIRREYMNYVVITNSGRVYSGLIAEQDGGWITILDAKNERIKIPRDEIDTLEESDVSLMPERILDSLTPQQLRDLFAYIEGEPGR